MLVYIIHQDKIIPFRISNETDGKYLLTDIDRYNNKRNLVNVEVLDKKVYIYDNNNVKISYNGKKVSRIQLCIGNFYSLDILENETINLYVMPLCDESFFEKGIKEDVSLICGCDPKSDIIYNIGISKKQLQLDYKNGKWSFMNLDTNFPIFVNKIRKDFGQLENFDTIFIMGLKIIICKNKLFINNPNRLIYIYATEKFIETTDNILVKDKVNDIRTYTNFYDESQYYFKSPIFKSQINTLRVHITEPPTKESREKSSVLMTVIPSFLMTFSSLITGFYTIQRYNAGNGTKEELITSLVISGAMIVGGIIWPFVERFYTNAKAVSTNIKRKRNYKKYLKEKRNLIESAKNEQKIILETNNLLLSNCQTVIENKTAELFSRDIENSDFLNIRLGKGKIKLDCEIDYQKPDYNPIHDDLIDDIDKLIEDSKYINDAPVIFNLMKKNVVAFILENRNQYEDYMNGIILQLLTYHSYYDLKLVVLTNSTSSEISFLRNSNHCWNNERTYRYYASNIEEAQKISTELEREFQQRKNSDKKTGFSPYYLIISDSIDLYRNLNIINDIIDNGKGLNFGLIMYDMKISNIPNDCINFINIGKSSGTVFQTNMNEKNIINFIPEFVSQFDVNVDYCSRKISNIPLKDTNNQASTLPDSIGFLQMYGIGNVEQFNSLERWDNSTPYNSLSVPVGVDTNGNYILLDLHEKSHGPHGLIAGMTGSGKSEFIVTYILSLALNYRPEEVQFVLIDYKGGGLAGAFENRKAKIKLPHLVGTITNLDKSEMKRTLVSIKSEMQRRQKLFNEAKDLLDTGNIDIYKYQKLHRDGTLSEPLSHLFIICDEFAELKAQEPDFMDELISAARIGRSLGIHLILATQKPSGVVDEQIWSNSKFKICCKVQTTDDSNEMIKKPDAAYLKEAGRFYLQVGYDEYFIEGQSAYSGMPYIPTETINYKIDNSISFITNTGEIYKSINDKSKDVNNKKEDKGEELINILKYIIRISEKRGYKYQQLWLDKIPDLIYYNPLVQKYNATSKIFDINPIIGEFDDPKNQRQGIVRLPITTGGNTYIVGSNGSGKSTLLSSIIYSSIINHNCQELNLYILDLGTEKLKKFQNAPQVGDVLTINDSDKIKYLFYMLEDQKNKRQNYYSTIGTDFLVEMQNGKCHFPNIVVILYDIEAFREVYSDLYDEKFVSYTRNCSKYGINFIVTGTATNSLGFMAENNFPQKIMLNMIDPTDYLMYFDDAPIPNKNPGRGLIKLDNTYEFQVPLLFELKDELQNLNYVFDQLNKFLKNPAKKVPTVPDKVKLDLLKQNIESPSCLPLGVNVVTAQLGYFNFNKKISIMSSSTADAIIRFIESFTELLSFDKNNVVIVLNALKDTNFNFKENIKSYNSSFKKIIELLVANVEKAMKQNSSDKKYYILILGYNNLYAYINSLKEEDPNTKTLDDLINLESNDFRYILYDPSALFNEIKNGSLSNYVNTENGIWIGKGFESQSSIESSSYGDSVKVTNDMIVIVKNGKSEYIKYSK